MAGIFAALFAFNQNKTREKSRPAHLDVGRTIGT
jgi:hypothetical protein